MLPMAHAKFRANPMSFDGVLKDHVKINVPGRPSLGLGVSRPENRIFFMGHSYFMLPMGHAKFRANPMSFDGVLKGLEKL